MDEDAADASPTSEIPTRLCKLDRIRLGIEMLGLFESSLRNMTLSAIAAHYKITTSETVNLMCEAMTWNRIRKRRR